MAKLQGIGLVGDIGGTNCRYALVRAAPRIEDPVSYRNADFANFLDTIEAYLARDSSRVDWAVIAVAGPIVDNAVAMTNRPWRVDGNEIAERFGMRSAMIINDFSALAASTPHIAASHLERIGGGEPLSVDGVTTTAIVGPGTGLGVGGLVCGPFGVTVLSTEGGHATFAPSDDIEREILRVLTERFEHVSNERLICGDGLRNIHWALSRIAGVEPEVLKAAEVSRRALAKEDRLATQALLVFSRALGAFAGNVVLTLGARGGIYLAGGMLPAIKTAFDRDAFRERFETKGRLNAYMQGVPTWMMIDPFAALVGAAALSETNLI